MRYIDLFAGAGGFSEGFKRAGFIPVAHVEMNAAACLTLKTRLAYYFLKEKNSIKNYYDYLKAEITRKELYSLIPEDILGSVVNLCISDENNSLIFNRIDELISNKPVDIIIGGPPCQAYSVIGRARDKNGMKGDPRNYLYVQYGRFLKKYNPQLFVFENVTGIISAGNGRFFKNIQKYFKRIGYIVEPYVVNANDFGVLQNRKRVIIIGWNKDLNLSIGKLSDKTRNHYEVASIFTDLPKLTAGDGKDKYLHYSNGINEYLKYSKIRNKLDILTQHVTRPNTKQDKEIYRYAVNMWRKDKERLNYNDLPNGLKTHKNRKSFLDRFKVVADNLPYSQTIVAHIAKDGHYYIHPDLKQNRSISVREAARLQSFPDDYYFEGIIEGQNRTAAFQQIGNAVPPLMIEKIAKKLYGYIK